MKYKSKKIKNINYTFFILLWIRFDYLSRNRQNYLSWIKMELLTNEIKFVMVWSYFQTEKLFSQDTLWKNFLLIPK